MIKETMIIHPCTIIEDPADPLTQSLIASLDQPRTTSCIVTPCVKQEPDPFTLQYANFFHNQSDTTAKRDVLVIPECHGANPKKQSPEPIKNVIVTLAEDNTTHVIGCPFKGENDTCALTPGSNHCRYLTDQPPAVRDFGDYNISLDIPETLAARRKELGLSQKAVAEFMGTAQSAVSDIESRRNKNPGIETMARFAETVGAEIVVIWEKN